MVRRLIEYNANVLLTPNSYSNMSLTSQFELWYVFVFLKLVFLALNWVFSSIVEPSSRLSAEASFSTAKLQFVCCSRSNVREATSNAVRKWCVEPHKHTYAVEEHSECQPIAKNIYAKLLTTNFRHIVLRTLLRSRHTAPKIVRVYLYVKYMFYAYMRPLFRSRRLNGSIGGRSRSRCRLEKLRRRDLQVVI